MRISWKPTTSILVGALVVAVVAALTVAVSSATGAGRPGAVVTVCAGKADGSLRLVDKRTSCRRSERPVTWNRRGVPGSDGVDGTNGADGAVGPRGPDGAPGMSGYQIVEQSTAISGFYFGNVYVSCPQGKRVVGGGVTAIAASGQDVGTGTFMVRSQWPSADGTTWAATVEVSNATTVQRFVVRAVCVSVAS